MDHHVLRSATLSRAERERGLAASSSSLGLTGFLVITLSDAW